MNAVETTIMQTVLKAVKDYNNVINILDPGVKTYFRRNYNDLYQVLGNWEFIKSGNFIKITYIEQYLDGRMEHCSETVPLETIVKLAAEFII